MKQQEDNTQLTDTQQGAEIAEGKSNGRLYLELLLNKPMKIEICDGRTLIGQFLCTDHDKNIILGSCQEYIGKHDSATEEPRLLGLAMIPGRHIVNMHIDMDDLTKSDIELVMSGSSTEETKNSNSTLS